MIEAALVEIRYYNKKIYYIYYAATQQHSRIFLADCGYILAFPV